MLNTAKAASDRAVGGACQPTQPEPEFDINRVVWDIDYRQRVMDLLKRWRDGGPRSGPFEYA
jgi:hypothetical protein